ncbi:MAG: methylenetetrahydrofolate reductase [NAD(P)H] [Alphaproteobacteria bacterium]|nr:methylenetetrahydrofolate reductase [NAD(P)H] [Alphaproteobacteria bacterium]
MNRKVSVSFEFFPPKNDEGEEALWQKIDRLATLKPEFITITYGAGGSTRNWTVGTAGRAQVRTNIPTGAHMTCVNATKDDVRTMAEALWQNNIRHIVALRGDIPKIDAPLDYNDFSYYHYANELVAGLKALHPFEISVGAYPEKHPEAPDLATDIQNLKRKCDTGVTRAITQFFFENETFFRFLDLTAKAGITTPIVPGVIPVLDYDRMIRFAGNCQAHIPDSLKARLEPLKGQPQAFTAAATDLLNSQCADLVQRGGIEHIHFYTLNHDELPYSACQTLGLGL